MDIHNSWSISDAWVKEPSYGALGSQDTFHETGAGFMVGIRLLSTGHRGKKVMVGVLALLLGSGCASLGPTTINRDRFDYITAISES